MRTGLAVISSSAVESDPGLVTTAHGPASVGPCGRPADRGGSGCDSVAEGVTCSGCMTAFRSRAPGAELHTRERARLAPLPQDAEDLEPPSAVELGGHEVRAVEVPEAVDETRGARLEVLAVELLLL